MTQTTQNKPPYHASNPFRELTTSQVREESYYAYGIRRSVERLEECLDGNINWNDMKKRIADALMIMKAITPLRIETRTDPEAAADDQIVEWVQINNAEKISRIFLEQEDNTIAHSQYQLSDRTELFSNSSAFVIDLKKIDNFIY